MVVRSAHGCIELSSLLNPSSSVSDGFNELRTEKAFNFSDIKEVWIHHAELQAYTQWRHKLL